eukprot:489335-Prorocentrum_lima.AAC.1
MFSTTKKDTTALRKRKITTTIVDIGNGAMGTMAGEASTGIVIDAGGGPLPCSSPALFPRI